MKINTFLVGITSLGLLLIAAGCASYNHTQYLMQGPPNLEGKRTAATPLQREAVRVALAKLAKDMRFRDRTERSVVPNVIGAYGEEDKLKPITFTAWMEGGSIVIDVLHQPGEPGESLRYQTVRDRIFSELNRQFPNDIRLTARGHQPVATPQLPLAGTGQ